MFKHNKIDKFSIRKLKGITGSVKIGAVVAIFGATIAASQSVSADVVTPNLAAPPGVDMVKVDTDLVDTPADEGALDAVYADVPVSQNDGATEGTDTYTGKAVVDYSYVLNDGSGTTIKPDVLDVEQGTNTVEVPYDKGAADSNVATDGKDYRESTESAPLTLDVDAGKEDKITVDGKEYKYVDTQVEGEDQFIEYAPTTLGDVTVSVSPHKLHNTDGSINYDEVTGDVWLVEETEDGTYGKFTVAQGISDDETAATTFKDAGDLELFTQANVEAKGGFKHGDTIIILDKDRFGLYGTATASVTGLFGYDVIGRGVYAKATSLTRDEFGKALVLMVEDAHKNELDKKYGDSLAVLPNHTNLKAYNAFWTGDNATPADMGFEFDGKHYNWADVNNPAIQDELYEKYLNYIANDYAGLGNGDYEFNQPALDAVLDEMNNWDKNPAVNWGVKPSKSVYNRDLFGRTRDDANFGKGINRDSIIAHVEAGGSIVHGDYDLHWTLFTEQKVTPFEGNVTKPLADDYATSPNNTFFEAMFTDHNDLTFFSPDSFGEKDYYQPIRALKVSESIAKVTYLYQEIGNVTVAYVDAETGKELIAKKDVVRGGDVGSDYETDDHPYLGEDGSILDLQTALTKLANGDKVYVRVDVDTDDVADGQVPSGTTDVVYAYRPLTITSDIARKELGVTVAYVNEEGETIAPTETATKKHLYEEVTTSDLTEANDPKFNLPDTIDAIKNDPTFATDEVGYDANIDESALKKDRITAQDGKVYEFKVEKTNHLVHTLPADEAKVLGDAGNTYDIVLEYRLVKEETKDGDLIETKGIVNVRYMIEGTEEEIKDLVEAKNALVSTTQKYVTKSGDVVLERREEVTPTNEQFDTAPLAEKTIKAKDGKVYELVQKRSGEEAGTLKEGVAEVIYEYRLVKEEVKEGELRDTKVGKVEVKYFIEGTQEELKPKVDAHNGVVERTQTYVTKSGDVELERREEVTPTNETYDATAHKETEIVAADGKVYTYVGTRLGTEAGPLQEGTHVIEHEYKLKSEETKDGDLIETKGIVNVRYMIEGTDEEIKDLVEAKNALVSTTQKYVTKSGDVELDRREEVTPTNEQFDTAPFADKTITAKDGKVYELVQKRSGEEAGTLKEGVAEVIYEYRLVKEEKPEGEPAETKGRVVVKFVKEGTTEEIAGSEVAKDGVVSRTQTYVTKSGDVELERREEVTPTNETYDTTPNIKDFIEVGDETWVLVGLQSGIENDLLPEGEREVVYEYRLLEWGVPTEAPEHDKPVGELPPVEEPKDENPPVDPNEDPKEEPKDENPPVAPNEDPKDDNPPVDPQEEPKEEPKDDNPPVEPNEGPKEEPKDDNPPAEPNEEPKEEPKDDNPPVEPNEDPKEEPKEDNPPVDPNEENPPVETKVPNEAPKHEKPEGKLPPVETKVPNEAPKHEKPEGKLPPVETEIPNEAPKHEKPEGKLPPVETEIPNEAPKHEKPEGNIPPTQTEMPGTHVPVAETPVTETPRQTSEKMLPNTGTKNSIAAVLSGLGLVGLAGFLVKKKREEQ